MDQGAASYRRFIDGDRDAFGEVIDLYRESLIFFIHRYVNDMDTAEDLAEDVFVELIVHPERFGEKSSLKTYVFAIARNKAIDWIRRHSRLRMAQRHRRICFHWSRRFLTMRKSGSSRRRWMP